MEEDIKILAEFIELDRKIRQNKVESDYDEFCERRCIAIENLLKENKCSKATINILTNKLEKVVEENEELKQEITVLQNTKDSCPAYKTSGINCSLKEDLEEE